MVGFNMTENYIYEERLYQRGINDFTVEQSITSTKNGKVIYQHLMDVLVYNCSTVKGKRLYSWLQFTTSNQKQNNGEIEI